MTEAIARREETGLLVIPGTGEAIELAAETGELARALEEIRALESALREAKRRLGAEVLSRMDAAASWTLRAGGLELRGESPAPKIEWDGAALALTLEALVEEGKIAPEAAQAALSVEVSYKPQARGLSALMKLGGEVAEKVGAHSREVERDRRPPSVRPVA
jgi:hypothetical protein